MEVINKEKKYDNEEENKCKNLLNEIKEKKTILDKKNNIKELNIDKTLILKLFKKYAPKIESTDTYKKLIPIFSIFIKKIHNIIKNIETNNNSNENSDIYEKDSLESFIETLLETIYKERTDIFINNNIIDILKNESSMTSCKNLIDYMRDHSENIT